MPTSSMIPIQDKGIRCAHCGRWILCPCCGNPTSISLSYTNDHDGHLFCCKQHEEEYYLKRGTTANEHYLKVIAAEKAKNKEE